MSGHRLPGGDEEYDAERLSKAVLRAPLFDLEVSVGSAGRKLGRC
jgi:hypothetical protein